MKRAALLATLLLGSPAFAQDAAAPAPPAPGAATAAPSVGTPPALSSNLLPTPVAKATDDPGAADGTSASAQAYGAFQRGYYLSALRIAEPLANLGDPAAQTLLGEIYGRGLGVPRDETEAARWYGVAAKAGVPEAQFRYAMLLIEGRAVAHDDVAAAGLEVPRGRLHEPGEAGRDETCGHGAGGVQARGRGGDEVDHVLGVRADGAGVGGLLGGTHPSIVGTPPPRLG